MGPQFLSFETLPDCLKKIGNNINHLRYAKTRDLVNSELSKCNQEEVRLEFGVDEQDQLTGTYYIDDTKLGDSFAIRTNVLEEVIEKINSEYSLILTKKQMIMKKKSKKTANVAVVSNEANHVSGVSPKRKVEIDDLELLVNIISGHYAGSGNYQVLDKYIDFVGLFRDKTNGAVVNIVMSDTEITLQGVNGFEMTCPVQVIDSTVLSKHVSYMLKAIVGWHQMQSSDIPASSLTSSNSNTNEVVADENECHHQEGEKTCFNNIKNRKKVIEEYNKAVYNLIANLEKDLKGKCPSSSSQIIRKRLKLLANESGLKTKDMSGQSLISELNKENIDLLHMICDSAKCGVPSFLSKSSFRVKG